MYLNIGSHDKRIDGFINVDLEPLGDVRADVTEGLPFASESIDGVYSEHFIEHIEQHEAVRFFRECNRVLRPGARVRVATPDLRTLVEIYLSDDWRRGDIFEHGYEYVQTPAEKLNIELRHWGHRWVYDEQELSRLGRMAGLELVGCCPWGASDDPRLSGLEYRPGSHLVVEFQKRTRAVRRDQPLVSILIPAYRGTFLNEALSSARAQTYSCVEILVGDDCPDESVRRIVASHAAEDPRISLHRVGPGAGSVGNYLALFERANGEYIKFLNDDDLLDRRCVERQARCLAALPSVTLVTSHRQRIDEEGTPLPDDAATARRYRTDSVVDGPGAVGQILRERINWIGEPTTAMFRREDVDDLEPQLFAFAGRPVDMNVDVALWTRLLSRGDLVYLTESLSSFRQHAGQEQRVHENFRVKAHAAWAQLRFDGGRMGLGAGGRKGPRSRPLECKPWWSDETFEAIREADAALCLGDVDRATTALVRAHHLSSDDPSIIAMLGSLEHAIGSTAPALDRLLGYLSIHPDDLATLIALAQIAESTGHPAEAAELIQRAARLVPTDHELRGWVDQLLEADVVAAS